jgi:hypothetical protein
VKTILDLVTDSRTTYLKTLKNRVFALKSSGKYGDTINIADVDNRSSCSIAMAWTNLLPGKALGKPKSSQTRGNVFTDVCLGFLKETLPLMKDFRPGTWEWETEADISRFDQYSHLGLLRRITDENPNLKTIFGEEYFIRPDIVIARHPLTEREYGRRQAESPVAVHAPLLEGACGGGAAILHASISCKLTIRSDRAQNTRTEALNLMRNRKGNTPHIVALTAEPLPSRIASLALGMGDIDCVYHAALHELQTAVTSLANEDQMDILETLISGRRLRDISDLPFDLAV